MTRRKMLSMTEAGKSTPSRSESSLHVQSAIHQEFSGGLHGLHAPSLTINALETELLNIRIELSNEVPTQQLLYSSNKAEVPSFTSGLPFAASDSSFCRQLGYPIPAFDFPRGTRGFDFRYFTITLKALALDRVVYLRLRGLDPSKFLYLPISITSRRMRVVQSHTYVHYPVPSGYDGPFDTRTPSVAARTSPHVEMVQSRDHLIPRESNSRDEVWDPHEMLALGDIVRTIVRKGSPLDSYTLKTLKEALDLILKGEISGNKIDFERIVFARFDKVIVAIIETELGIPKDLVVLNQALSSARKIHAFWQKRYAERLSDINSERAAQLTSIMGRLAFVVLIKRPSQGGNLIWVAIRRVPGAGSGIRQVELGHWFLNMACVYRDGLSNSQDGTEKYGPNEIATLPLLKGIETFKSNSPVIYYNLEGNREDMLLYLQDKVGKEIRILRGHLLKSPWAPRAGIRYDGWHFLNTYSIKRLADGSGKYSVELRYTRRANQLAVEDYADVTFKPSMADDWEMYEKITDRKFKAYTSPEVYALWRSAREDEEKERSKWHQSLDMMAGKTMAGFA